MAIQYFKNGKIIQESTDNQLVRPVEAGEYAILNGVRIDGPKKNKADLNGDGVVDEKDLSIVHKEYSKSKKKKK